MKKQDKRNESIFAKKGFYVALYSTIGTMLIVGAVMSVVSFNSNKTGKELANLENQDQITSPVSGSTDQSYLTPSDKMAVTSLDKSLVEEIGKVKDEIKAESKEETKVKEETKLKEEAKPKEETKTNNNDSSKEVPKTDAPTEKPAGVTENSAENEVVSETEENEEDIVNTNNTESHEVTVSEDGTEPVFNVYSENTPMEWPLLGEIAMNYSVDRTIYDETLQQYRTNDYISIAAPVGTPVKAAAEGVVSSITNTVEGGNSVVINHGNDWTTTYSQLQDGVLVEVGEVVANGQVIGGVNKPSIYSILLGSHLDFKVAKEEASVDPMVILAKLEN